MSAKNFNFKYIGEEREDHPISIYKCLECLNKVYDYTHDYIFCPYCGVELKYE